MAQNMCIPPDAQDLLGDSAEHLLKAIHRYRTPTLIPEDEAAGRFALRLVIPPEQHQFTLLCDGVSGINPVLQTLHGKLGRFQVDVLPLEVHQLGYP